MMPTILEHNDEMPFGKYKGRKMEDVPDSYLVWCYEQEDMRQRWPELIAYIVNNAHRIPDIILDPQDRI